MTVSDNDEIVSGLKKARQPLLRMTLTCMASVLPSLRVWNEGV